MKGLGNTFSIYMGGAVEEHAGHKYTSSIRPEVFLGETASEALSDHLSVAGE